MNKVKNQDRTSEILLQKSDEVVRLLVVEVIVCLSLCWSALRMTNKYLLIPKSAFLFLDWFIVHLKLHKIITCMNAPRNDEDNNKL